MTAHSASAGTAHAQGGGEFHIPSLDGIRAISVMLVFVAHVGLGHMVPGGLGVTIFFFLSGYLITTLLRLERDRTGRTSLRDFYLRRVFRILPPFYTVLAFALLLTAAGLLPEQLHLGSVLSQLAHATNYWIIFGDAGGFPSGTAVYWSLAVEEHFYLVFPCLFILMQRVIPRERGVQGALLFGLCALTLLWRLVLVLGYDVPEERTYLATDTRIDSILFGCALAVSANPMLDAWRGGKALWTRVLFPLACAALVASLIYRAPWFRETLRYSVQGLALIPIFVVAIRYPDWGPIPLLNTRLLRRVGLLSYSIYLCHQVLLSAIELALPDLGMLVTASLTLALSFGFATLVLHFVERPSAKARKAWVSTAWLKPASPAPEGPPAEPARAS